MTEEEARQEAVYASLDWDTNPPINGFYESMMALGVEGRARLRQRIREQKATQPELFYTQEDTPKTQAQERRPRMTRACVRHILWRTVLRLRQENA